MKPLWMVFENLDPLGDKVYQIFKQGDGVLTMQTDTTHNASPGITALFIPLLYGLCMCRSSPRHVDPANIGHHGQLLAARRP